MAESILETIHRQAGAKQADCWGVGVPTVYRDIESEYRALTLGAALIDWAPFGLLEMRGPDRVTFLHNLLTQDINRLSPGEGRHAALVTPTAKLLAELWVLAGESSHWLIVLRERLPIGRDTLEKYHIAEDIELLDQSAGMTWIALQGPQSGACLSRALGADAPSQALHHQLVTIDGASVHVVALRLAASEGFVLAVPTANAGRLWSLLERQGATPAGWKALDVARIETGIPWWGADITEEHLLPETGLESDAISEHKGCYVGQEIIARMLSQGSASRKLVRLELSGKVVPEPGDAIVRGDEPVGTITSSCWSPALSRPIALGYVKRPYYAAGQPLDVVRGAAHLEAGVSR